MNKLLSIALMMGLLFAAACSSDSSGSGSPAAGGNGSASSGCQRLSDCCASLEAAKQPSCNSAVTQANGSDAVCAGVVSGYQSSGLCGGTGAAGGGQAGAGGNGDAGQSAAGAGGAGNGGPQPPECATLATCCSTLMAGVKDGCDHIVGLNAGPSCASILKTYQNGGQCLPMAAKTPFSCDTSSTNNTCFQELADSTTLMYLPQSCTSGTIGTACPAANLVGCCTGATGITVCEYNGAGSADDLGMNCAATSGTWSTSVPPL